MFLLLNPVPGIDIDPLIPDFRAFSVSWNGPSLKDFEYDLMPCSVTLKPAMLRSKLIDDFFELLMTFDVTRFTKRNYF